VLIPLIISVYDSFRLQRLQSRSHGDAKGQNLDETTYDAIQRWYSGSRFRYVLPTFLVTYGCHLASGLWSSAPSTYICPLVVGQTRTIPILQFIAAVLDCYLAIATREICLQRPTGRAKVGANTLLFWGSVLLVRFPSTSTYSPTAENLCSRQHPRCGP
jgi:hypothetical protein